MAESDEQIWGRPPTNNVYRGAAIREDDVAANTNSMQSKRGSNSSNMVQQAPFARPLAPLTQSRTIGRIPKLGDSGPVHDVLKIEHKGPIELLWEKIKAFVASLDNTDIQTISDDGKIQAYHYQLPRYVLFRVQIFENSDPDLPYVVEFQRREGDAYVHTVVFQHLRAVLAEGGSHLAQMENSGGDSASSSPYQPLTPAEANENFQSLDLRQSEQDLDLWIRHLNQPNLHSTQSASGALAMASRTKTNFPYLIKAADGILRGFQNCLKHSDDPPTLFACSVVLSTMSSQADWCDSLLKSGLLSLIISTIIKWKGSKLKSKQTVINLLLTLRCVIERVGAQEFIRAAGEEEVNRLFQLSKSSGLETDVSILLTSILEMLN